MSTALKVRCSAHSTRTGEQCKKWAVDGATVCLAHGAGAGQVRNKANVRAEVFRWGLGDATVDPGETLLRLVTQSAARAQRYADELEALVEESPSLREALVADIWVQPEHGESYKAGEYLRGLAQLEAQERDRCANVAAKAIAAGLAERQVRLAERQGEQMMAAVTAALGRMSLTPEQATQFRKELAIEVRALA
jgi:hypothetical protein